MTVNDSYNARDDVLGAMPALGHEPAANEDGTVPIMPSKQCLLWDTNQQ